MGNQRNITFKPNVKNGTPIFEFELRHNDNIICHRYFIIKKFNGKSLKSMELINTIDEIVNIIDEDLKAKSRIYCWYEYNPNQPHEEFSNKSTEKKSHFYFDFRMNDKCIVSKVWSADIYPPFIRHKVNLTNKIKHIECDENDMGRKTFLLKKIHENRKDLIPVIIKMLSIACK